MAAQNKIRRIIEMLLMLKNRYGVQITQIAERFDISERSVYRYITTFKEGGIIIEQQNGYFKISEESGDYKALSDLLHFSQEEAYILSKAIHSIDDNNLIKSNLVKKLYSLYDFDRVANTIVKKEHSEAVHAIFNAIRNKKKALFRSYSSAHAGIVRDRLVEPFDFTTNYISVWCYEPESRMNKLFKTARIGKVEVLHKDWAFESYHKAAFIDAFRISDYQLIAVKVRLSLRAKNLMIEEYPLTEKDIRKTENGSFIYDGKVCTFDGIGRFVLGLIDEVKIIHPPELKVFLMEKFARHNL